MILIFMRSSLVAGLVTAVKWRFPLTAYEFCLITKEFLDNKGIIKKNSKTIFLIMTGLNHFLSVLK